MIEARTWFAGAEGEDGVLLTTAVKTMPESYTSPPTEYSNAEAATSNGAAYDRACRREAFKSDQTSRGRSFTFISEST